jgi:hypothetical protein
MLQEQAEPGNNGGDLVRIGVDPDTSVLRTIPAVRFVTLLTLLALVLFIVRGVFIVPGVVVFLVLFIIIRGAVIVLEAEKVAEEGILECRFVAGP